VTSGIEARANELLQSGAGAIGRVGFAAAQRAAKEALTDPTVDIDRIAHRLHTSQRTLQRRLREAGTSCQKLIEQARREQVLQLLHDRRLSLAEIAFMSGYSEMSTFYRAFRRWTGQSPGEYRLSAGL